MGAEGRAGGPSGKTKRLGRQPPPRALHGGRVHEQFPVQVSANEALTGGYFRLTLDAGTPVATAHTRPGQFVMLRGLWGRDLLNGRAFSVLEVLDDRRFSVLAKVFGRGTGLMKAMEPGDQMTCLGPLGNGFPAVDTTVTSLLVAGGVGLPPLHLYAREAARQGAAPAVEMIYGGRTRDDLVLTDDLDAWKVAQTLTTEDGSRGVEGRVTAPLLDRLERASANRETVRILSCGPTPMLRAVRALALERGVEAHLCLEEQMACGYGVCLGCAVPVHGPRPYAYCCTDGPVFPAQEVRWT